MRGWIGAKVKQYYGGDRTGRRPHVREDGSASRAWLEHLTRVLRKVDEGVSVKHSNVVNVCVRVIYVLSAVMLACAAALKSHSPDAAVHAISWTGAGAVVRVNVIIWLSVAQATISACMLVFWMDAWSINIAAVMFCFLCAAHGGSVLMGVQHCGCFGDVQIPHSVVGVALAISVLNAWHLMKSPLVRVYDRGMGPMVARGAIVVIVSAITIVMVRPGRLHLSPDHAIVEAVGIPVAASRAVFVVGSRDCHHCQEALEELSRHLSVDMSTTIYFVISDAAPVHRMAELPNVKEVAVPAALWWSALPERPPGIIEYRRIEGVATIARFSSVSQMYHIHAPTAHNRNDVRD